MSTTRAPQTDRDRWAEQGWERHQAYLSGAQRPRLPWYDGDERFVCRRIDTETGKVVEMVGSDVRSHAHGLAQSWREDGFLGWVEDTWGR